ncbi:MAG: GMC family oxidoreductase N-terminal domain-containing protein [Spirosomataceae bacterium]
MAFLKPVLHRPNLQVITHAHTRQIIIENDRAVGIEFITGKNSTERALAQKEVILSAGSFCSPQLLMLSGIGDADELKYHGITCKKHLPGVEKNHKTICFSGSMHWLLLPTANDSLSAWGQIKGLAQYLFLKKGPLTISPLEANAF